MQTAISKEQLFWNFQTTQNDVKKSYLARFSRSSSFPGKGIPLNIKTA